MIHLMLPWPPSVNTYWRHPSRGPLAGRHLISEKGRAYRTTVAAAVGRCCEALTDRLSVVILAYPPDRRARDLDNLPKAIFDSLTHAGVWDDDGQIDQITVRRCQPEPPGRVEVYIAAITAEVA